MYFFMDTLSGIKLIRVTKSEQGKMSLEVRDPKFDVADMQLGDIFVRPIWSF